MTGLEAAALAGVVTNLVGGAIGISETAKANKALSQLSKERPQIGVPKEAYDGFNAAESERQFKKEGADRALSTSAGALLRDPRAAGMMPALADQANQSIRDAGITKFLRDQQINQQISQIKQQNQYVNMQNWQNAVNMANQRRVSGIQSAFSTIGTAATQVGNLPGIDK
jgi:hypothetical protein